MMEQEKMKQDEMQRDGVKQGRMKLPAEQIDGAELTASQRGGVHLRRPLPSGRLFR